MSFRYLLARAQWAQWAQWALGVVVCVVVALVVMTSAMVANEAQPNQRALRDVRSPPTNGCQALAMGELPGKVVRKGTGSLLVTSATKVDRWEPALIRLSDGAPVHLDPYKGMVMGDASGRMQRFLRSVLHWHRWLAMHSEAREVGWVITAWAKLGCFLLLLSGMYLWRPGRWGRRGRDCTWHNLIGAWLAMPLLVVVFSGMIVSFHWVADLVYRVVGEIPLIFGFHAPEWDMKKTKEAGVLSLGGGTGRHWAKQFDCALGRQAYETVGRCGFWELGLGRPIRHWLSLTHTSDMGEAVGQPVTGGVSLGACVMGWPGLTLA